MDSNEQIGKSFRLEQSTHPSLKMSSISTKLNFLNYWSDSDISLACLDGFMTLPT